MYRKEKDKNCQVRTRYAALTAHCGHLRLCRLSDNLSVKTIQMLQKSKILTAPSSWMIQLTKDSKMSENYLIKLSKNFMKRTKSITANPTGSSMVPRTSSTRETHLKRLRSNLTSNVTQSSARDHLHRVQDKIRSPVHKQKKHLNSSNKGLRFHSVLPMNGILLLYH